MRLLRVLSLRNVVAASIILAFLSFLRPRSDLPAHTVEDLALSARQQDLLLAMRMRNYSDGAEHLDADRKLERELARMTPQQRVLKNLMLATAEDIVLRAPKMSFLRGVRNPCFSSRNDSLVEDATIEDAILDGHEIWCLPYFFIAGFTKCGTTDLHARLILHSQVLSGNIGARPIKELHWFDNFHFDPNHKMFKYVKMYRNATQILVAAYRRKMLAGEEESGEEDEEEEEEEKWDEEKEEEKFGNGKTGEDEQDSENWQEDVMGYDADNTSNILAGVSDLGDSGAREFAQIRSNEDEARDTSDERWAGDLPLLGDFTPRYAWHGDRWHTEAVNQGLDEPLVLIPHKIHAVLPQAKIILIMRDPVARLLSDYNFQKFAHNGTSSHDLHRKVATAVRWWEDCLAAGLSERRCAYGYLYPLSLQPPLDYARCIVGPDYGCLEHEPENVWNMNPAPRLRIGLYYIFVKDWLTRFPLENILFLKFEEYVERPMEVIRNQVLPFLGIRRDFPAHAIAQLEKERESGLGRAKPGWYVSMLPETRALLRDFYAPYNSRLADLVGDRKFNWT